MAAAVASMRSSRRVTLVSREGFEFVMEPEAAAFLLQSLRLYSRPAAAAGVQQQGYSSYNMQGVDKIRLPQVSCRALEQLCRLLSLAYLDNL